MNGEIRPYRALLHPAFIVSVAVLALNDHFLKGSGILPDIVTGKLSDFAGLFAAPALLAALFRVRSRRGLLLAHVATGLGFTALQLVPAIAVALEGVLPVRIWSDPTDLIALPMQAVSYLMLRKAMHPGGGSTRAAHAMVGVGALVVCTATSYQPPEYPQSGTHFEAEVFLHNASPRPVYVGIMRPTDDVYLDCDTLLRNPGAVFDELETTEAIGSYTLQPGHNMPLLIGVPRPNQRCHVIAVNEDVIAWRAGALPMLAIPFEGRGHVPGEITTDGEHLFASAPLVVRRR